MEFWKKKEEGGYCNIKLEETPDKYREWKSILTQLKI
jgi:hypothetical protein